MGATKIDENHDIFLAVKAYNMWHKFIWYA